MHRVFGYGSLMNARSVHETLPRVHYLSRATLSGYQRKMNASCDGFLYLNIVPHEGALVEGVVLLVDEADMEELRLREEGYAAVDVTASLLPAQNECVVAFIAPDVSYPKLTILKSYLDICTEGMSEQERAVWLADTIIENPVLDDAGDPLYISAP